MPVDVQSAVWLIFANARLLDRHRLAVLRHGAAVKPVLDPSHGCNARPNENERLRPLTLSARPGARSRALFSGAQIEAASGSSSRPNSRTALGG